MCPFDSEAIQRVGWETKWLANLEVAVLEAAVVEEMVGEEATMNPYPWLCLPWTVEGGSNELEPLPNN